MKISSYDSKTTGIRRGYFEGDTGLVHYRSIGSGDPLILLHQSPLSSTQFDAVMPLLAAQGFEVVALDMPGFGMSDIPPEDATLETFASIISAALRGKGWARASIVGHHTGAVLAAVFGAGQPLAVTKLVLNGFPLLGAAERAHFASFYFGPKAPKPDGTHLLTAWENRLRSTPGWSDIELMHRYTVEALHRSATNWRAFPLVISADLEKVLQQLRVPTLLFTNTGEDLYESTKRAHALRADFFDYAQIEGGTHDIVDEQPEAWAATIVRYLRS